MSWAFWVMLPFLVIAGVLAVAVLFGLALVGVVFVRDMIDERKGDKRREQIYTAAMAASIPRKVKVDTKRPVA